MNILMVFSCREDLRLWLRDNPTTGKVSLISTRISFPTGTILLRVVTEPADLPLLRGQKFDLILYHKAARTPPAIREFLATLVGPKKSEDLCL